MAGSGDKDVLNMSFNSLHRARNLMFKEGLSPYSILSRKSISSVSMSVKGRNVTELISSSRGVKPHPDAVIRSSAATMRPSLLGVPSAGNPSVPSGNDCAVLFAFSGVGNKLPLITQW